jgi:hypothetical protein
MCCADVESHVRGQHLHQKSKPQHHAHAIGIRRWVLNEALLFCNASRDGLGRYTPEHDCSSELEQYGQHDGLTEAEDMYTVSGVKCAQIREPVY